MMLGVEGGVCFINTMHRLIASHLSNDASVSQLTQCKVHGNSSDLIILLCTTGQINY